MIELIVSWVTGIIFATLFATFLELLLPSSSMQTFVRVIMGLLIMLAILNPVVGFLERSSDNSDITALAPRNSSGPSVQEEAIAVARKRDKLVKEVYRRDLAKQMQSLVMGMEGVARASVDIKCSDEENGPMKIELVTVSVEPGLAKNQVRKVVIGDKPHAIELRLETATKIQQRLSELYQLQPKQITVRPMQG